MPAPHHILVVEDNLDAQYLTCEMLAALGHSALGATDATQALALLAAQDGAARFDVLFTDVSLPGMSGIELARKTHADYPDMKIVFASGYGASIAEYVGFAATSLPKPYDLTQLQAALDTL